MHQQHKLIGQGLQYRVYDHIDEKVIKTTTSLQEKRLLLNSFGITDKNLVKNYIIKTTILTRLCFRLVQKSYIDKKYFGNPIFLEQYSYIQDKLSIPRYTHLSENEIIHLTNDYVQLVYVLWQFGMHDRVMNFFDNCGYNQDGELVLCDFGELTNNIKRVKRSLYKRSWYNAPNIKKIPYNIRTKVVAILDNSITLPMLKKHWKTRI